MLELQLGVLSPQCYTMKFVNVYRRQQQYWCMPPIVKKIYELCFVTVAVR